MIEQYVAWNEDIGEWQLKCVAYTGNNMRKQSPVPDKEDKVRTQATTCENKAPCRTRRIRYVHRQQHAKTKPRAGEGG